MASKATVVNIHKDNCNIYIGRPSIFGNPFVIGRDGNRQEVIEKHRVYFNARLLNDPEFKRRIHALRGKKLGCYCHPLPCHGDTITAYLDTLPS